MRRTIRRGAKPRGPAFICFPLFGGTRSWGVTQEVHTCYPNNPLMRAGLASSKSI